MLIILQAGVTQCFSAEGSIHSCWRKPDGRTGKRTIIKLHPSSKAGEEIVINEMYPYNYTIFMQLQAEHGMISDALIMSKYPLTNLSEEIQFIFAL